SPAWPRPIAWTCRRATSARPMSPEWSGPWGGCSSWKRSVVPRWRWPRRGAWRRGFRATRPSATSVPHLAPPIAGPGARNEWGEFEADGRRVMSLLKDNDPEVFAAIAAEEHRQLEELELIASENYTSRAIMEAVGSVLTNKYAEGLPGRRYYGGCQHVD